MQPTWLPPNLRFEIDDATQPWTWSTDTFDFVHIRYLVGAIPDWTALLKEAYRCTKPGGWTQTCEADVTFHSDDNTVEVNPTLETWGKLFREGGRKFGRSFTVLEDDLQQKGMKEAGFTDIQVVNYKVWEVPLGLFVLLFEVRADTTVCCCLRQLPVGGWPADAKLSEIGRYVQLTIESDIEGKICIRPLVCSIILVG